MRTIILLVIFAIIILTAIGWLIYNFVQRANNSDRITAKNAKREAGQQRLLIRKIENAALEEQRLGFNAFAQTVLNDIEDYRKELNR